MKGAHKRYMERQTKRSYSKSMNIYEQVLNYVSSTQGDGKNYRQDERKLDVRMKVGNVYAVRANDDPNYFFTITLQNDPFTGGFRKLVSQLPVYGDPPPGMEEISAEQVYKQFRELNGDGAFSNLNAFPFRGASVPPQGASGNGLVSQNHQDQQKRTGR